jgi:VanZ family protein
MVLIAWCAAIFLFTSLPAFTDENTMRIFLWTGLPPIMADIIDFIVRKLTHVTLFAGLAYIALKAIKPARWDYLLAWVLATLYGASDEWHQLYVIGRTGSIRDVFIDSCGAFLVLLVVYMGEKRIKKPQ